MTITRPTGPQVSALVDISRAITGRTDAVVIGAGVIGLTTAIRLAESGATTRIVTVDDPAETTSVLATAMVGSTFGFSGPRASAWEDETVRAFMSEPLAPGVHLCRGRFLAEPADFVPPSAEELPGFALCEPAGFPEGFGTGFWAQVPLVDMPPFMAHLVDRFTSVGGAIEHRELSSVRDTLASRRLCELLRPLGTEPGARPGRATLPRPEDHRREPGHRQLRHRRPARAGRHQLPPPRRHRRPRWERHPQRRHRP